MPATALVAVEDSTESQELPATESQELQRRATKKTKSHEAELGFDSPKVPTMPAFL